MVDIELPDRSKIKTVGDMVRIITADEEVILLKNADLKALREYVKNIKMVDNKNAE